MSLIQPVSGLHWIGLCGYLVLLLGGMIQYVHTLMVLDERRAHIAREGGKKGFRVARAHLFATLRKFISSALIPEIFCFSMYARFEQMRQDRLVLRFERFVDM